MRSLSAAATALVGLAILAPAASAADKSGYGLFSPTPDRLLRDMTTDRPDITESPFTVDAGRVQIESTIFAYARSHHDADGVVTRSFEIAPTNVRLGVTSWWEVGIVLNPYAHVTTHTPGEPQVSQSGIGAVDLRMKVNVWGNDAFAKPGDTALALLPILTLPTDRDNGIGPRHVEGGLVVPLGIVLTDKFTLGLNAGAMRVHNDDADAYRTEALASASLAYAWSDKFGTYYEVAASKLQGEEAAVTLATGFTYKLTDNLQLDGGLNVGVTETADALNPFLGLSARF